MKPTIAFMALALSVAACTERAEPPVNPPPADPPVIDECPNAELPCE